MSTKRHARRLAQVVPQRAQHGTDWPAAVLPMPAIVPVVSARTLATARSVEPLAILLRRVWRWLRTDVTARLQPSKTRRLRLAETLSLGEKRFVSLVEVDGQAFLIAASSAGISLLAECQGKRAEPTIGSALTEARWPERESA